MLIAETMGVEDLGYRLNTILGQKIQKQIWKSNIKNNSKVKYPHNQSYMHLLLNHWESIHLYHIDKTNQPIN